MDRLALAGVCLVALAASHGASFFYGRATMQTEIALEQAATNSAASDANSTVADAVNEAGGQQGQSAAQSLQESADARRQFQRHEAAPAPAGYVGGASLVDPALAADYLCRVERLRHDQNTAACGDAATDQPEPGATGRGGL